MEECFEDLTPHIFALETGLSSDPPMNWRLSSLDRYTLVSNSDAHSPQKLAREAGEASHLLDLGQLPPDLDGQIAAVAATNRLTLVTANLADFERFEGLAVESWLADRDV